MTCLLRRPSQGSCFAVMFYVLFNCHPAGSKAGVHLLSFRQQRSFRREPTKAFSGISTVILHLFVKGRGLLANAVMRSSCAYRDHTYNRSQIENNLSAQNT